MLDEFATQKDIKQVFIPTTALRINLTRQEKPQQLRRQWSHFATDIFRCASFLGKAFSVVNVGHHWAPVVIDFEKEAILFGHSSDNGQLDDENGRKIRTTVVDLLKYCKIPWKEYKCHLLDVPQQNGGGSCGIIALNVIETSFRRPGLVERWTLLNANSHRLWYLHILTGQSWKDKVHNTN